MLQPSEDRPEQAQLAVSPTGRAAHVYLLPGEGDARRPGEVGERLAETEGVDLVCWLEGADGAPLRAPSRGCRPQAASGRWSSAAASGCASAPATRSPTCAAAAGTSRGTSTALEATVEDGRLRQRALPGPARPRLRRR